MSEQLARILLQHQIKRKTETLKRGWSRIPEWVFCTEAGTLPDESRVRKVMRKTLKAARLPLHFSPPLPPPQGLSRSLLNLAECGGSASYPLFTAARGILT